MGILYFFPAAYRTNPYPPPLEMKLFYLFTFQAALAEDCGNLKQYKEAQCITDFAEGSKCRNQCLRKSEHRANKVKPDKKIAKLEFIKSCYKNCKTECKNSANKKVCMTTCNKTTCAEDWKVTWRAERKKARKSAHKANKLQKCMDEHCKFECEDSHEECEVCKVDYCSFGKGKKN